MIAIATLFSQGIFEHYLALSAFGIDAGMSEKELAVALAGSEDLRWTFYGMVWSGRIGLWLLWIAAALTLITGADYLRKALPFLRETR